MITRTPSFAPRRPSATLVPFRTPSTSVDLGRPADSRRRKPATRNRPALELMEERTLLSGVTIPTSAIYTLNNYTPNPVVSLSPMENTVVQGTTGFFSPTASMKVNLQSGEILTTQTIGFSNEGSYLVPISLTGPTSGSVSPVSQNGSSSVDFTAPSTGTYTVTVGANYLPPTSFFLTMRPIELINRPVDPAGSPADAALVSYFGGGLYAWMNGSHNELTFSGPTGIGFQIGGNWSESTTYTSGVGYTSTYTDTGYLLMNMGNFEPTLPLPEGTAFTVTTLADGSAGLFGQVTGEGLKLDGPDVTELLGSFYTLAGSGSLSLPWSVFTLPEVSVGIDLGSSPGAKATALPLDPAIPYLHFSLSTGVGLNFGDINVSAANSYSVGVAIDPADPSFGVDIQGIPVLSEVALEVSQNATIPYTPAAAPKEWTGGTLYGDVYLKGKVDIAAVTDDLVPLSAAGSLTANLDPTHQGLTAAISNNFQHLLQGKMSGSQVANYLEHISLGIDGEVDLSLSAADVFTIELPAFQGSVIYDGAQQTLYVHAGSVNVFENTPLASFLPYAGTSFDGMVDFQDGQFQFTAGESFSFGGLGASGELTVNNSGLGLQFDASADWNVSAGPVSASFDASLENTLSIGFSTGGEFNFSATTALSGSASAMGQKWSVSGGSYSWSTSGNVIQMEQSLRTYVGAISSNVVDYIDNAIENWVSNAGSSIWHKITSLF